MVETALHAWAVNAFHDLDLFPEIDPYACDEPGEVVVWPWQCKRSLRMIVFSYLLKSITGYPTPEGHTSQLHWKTRTSVH